MANLLGGMGSMAYRSMESSKEPTPTADENNHFLKSIKDGSRGKQFVLFSLGVVVILSFVVLLVWKDSQSTVASPSPVVMQPPFSGSELKFEKKINELQDQINVLKQTPPDSVSSKEMEGVRQELNNLSVAFHSLSDLVQAQESLLGELRVSIQDNKEKLSALNQPVVEETPDKASETAVDDLLLSDAPPFRLLTVEYWEDKPTALLELNGKVKSVQAGDYVVQWKIVKINALGRSIEVAPQNNLSQIQTLEVGA